VSEGNPKTQQMESLEKQVKETLAPDYI